MSAANIDSGDDCIIDTSINSSNEAETETRSRRWSMRVKRVSLKNLLLGLHTSSWTARSRSSVSSSSTTEESAVASTTSSPSPTVATGVESPVAIIAGDINNSDDVDLGGGKTIDYWGSVALLINTVTGGGMVLFAQLYQEAGWLLPSLCLLLLMCVCGLGGLMFIEAMAMMPHNGQFKRRIEYNTVIQYYCNSYVYMIISVFYQLSLTVTNLSLIIQSAQVTDFFIALVSGKACAVPQFYPSVSFGCVDAIDNNITPFDPEVFVLPVGLIMLAVIVIPIGFYNLDDNIKIQKAAFVSLIVIELIWLGILIDRIPSSSAVYVPTVGGALSSVLGTSLFNFAFITSVPSWVNEKKPNVSIVKVLWTVLGLAVFMFVTTGWVGGAAFETWTNTETLLDKVKDTGTLGTVTFFLFPIIVNLSSIPVLSIFQRYNLLKQNVCKKRMANFLAVIFPWLLAIPLYNGRMYQDLANWGGVLITSVVNFLVPLIVYIIAVNRREKEREIVKQQLEEPMKEVYNDDPTCTDNQIQSGSREVVVSTATNPTKAPSGAPSIREALLWLKRKASMRQEKTNKEDESDNSNNEGLKVNINNDSFSFIEKGTLLPSEHDSSSYNSASFSIASTDTAPYIGESASSLSAASTSFTSSSSPSSHLNRAAQRWANEVDQQNRATSSSLASYTSSNSDSNTATTQPRDLVQPISGSLKIAASGTVSPTDSPFFSPLTLSASSARRSNRVRSQPNLLQSLSSSFSGSALGLDHKERELEMGAMPAVSSSLASNDSSHSLSLDDTLANLGAIAVEEERGAADSGIDSDIEGEDDSSAYDNNQQVAPTALSELPESSASIMTPHHHPHDIQALIETEEKIDESYTHSRVLELVGEDDAGLVWHIVKPEYEKYRIPVAVVALAIMLGLCIVALEQQIVRPSQ